MVPKELQNDAQLAKDSVQCCFNTLNVEPCLWPAKQICSFMYLYHVIKVTDLV